MGPTCVPLETLRQVVLNILVTAGNDEIKRKGKGL